MHVICGSSIRKREKKWTSLAKMLTRCHLHQGSHESQQEGAADFAEVLSLSHMLGT